MSSNPPGKRPGDPNQRASGSNALASSTSVDNTAPTAEGGSGSSRRSRPCRYFQRGSCKDGTKCKYLHGGTTPEGSASVRPSFERHPVKSTRTSNSNFPGLSNDHFSRVVLNQTWGRTSSSLANFVADSFRFKIPSQVYQFLDLLCSASSQNTATWTPKEGQSHLHKLVKGNGIERLADAIRFPKETTRPWSFQRGYIPIFTYLSSEWVVKSTLHGEVNALYGLVHREFQTIREIVETNMDKLMVARSFKDNSPTPQISGMQVFKAIFVTIFEYLTRFKEAPITNPGICDFTEQMVHWFDEWVAALGSNPPFQDECTTYEEDRREFMIENLRRDKERILRLIRRGQTVVIVNNEARESIEPPIDAEPGLIAAFERVFEYDGPGDLCETGPRHDNDHAEIEMIRVAPTSDELLCEDDPYLPATFFEAPHFHDPRSIERLLDIQFRLLREELRSPVCAAVQLVVDDLRKSRSGISVLLPKINTRTGLYIGPVNARESVRFLVFTGVAFQSLELNRRGVSAGIEFDTPHGKAKSSSPAVRAGFWTQLSSKKLMQDGLVALIWRTPKGKVDVYVGTVTSASQDLVRCARRPAGQDRVSIHVSFFDEQANIRIMKSLQSHRGNNDTCVLIEAPVFYEGLRPFLEGLKREPESLPFAEYLKLQSRDELSRMTIHPPLYSRAPGFSFELKDLFPPEAGVESLRLTTRDPDSVANVRARLVDSRLDPSQAEAVVDTLTREVALIQGPPGTGKSYTGLELIRVLIKNALFPILLVAFTNHALDHLLLKILDEGITKNIIRLGSRSDERLEGYSLDKIQKVQSKSGLGAARKDATRKMKELESQMTALMDSITSHKVPSSLIEEHISDMYPHHHGELFQHVPPWIDAITPKPSDEEEGWEVAGETPHQEQSIIDFWLKGYDLQFLEGEGPEDATDEASAQVPSFNPFNILSDFNTTGDEPTASTWQIFLRDFMSEHGLKNVPKVPKTKRPVGALQRDPRVWRMSRTERTALHKAWSIEASDSMKDSRIQEFEALRQSHKSASEAHKEITAQLKAEILSRSHIVGCTTTGAAKQIPLLSGMGPKVMIVEEAGQVLESHILASLVGSIEHVILIGDPKQLRPNINCYKMATENPRTGYIYKFDRSLMERLSSGGFPMSQINVQRRMRPEISSLIKNTLYPNLQDNERVLTYPNVRGMYKNMYFVSHTHKEAGGGEESVSKHNSFEVDMIHDLILHLLKQGCYNKPENIVVLAAYLGQILKIRKKLEGIVNTVIDERDAELLERHAIGQEETATVQQVQLSNQITIRTLDNFQGEEGEVIILSLARNRETPFDEEAPNLEHGKGKSVIGFLRNENRTNVGLSRAKHGLYIFGNAPELAQGSKMWSGVLKELHSSECLGPKLPIACYRHPHYVRWIENPGDIPIASPNGGCDQPCGEVLPCGHICPSLCHADDPNHVLTKCQQPCIRLCPLSHPCDRQCWECSKDTSNCRFPITDLELPCGHVHPPTLCHVVNIPAKIKCPIEVVKQLPSCGHDAIMPCHQDPASYECQEQVLKELPKCRHRITIPCFQDPGSLSCQERVEKVLGCGHRVQMSCSQDPADVICSQHVERRLDCNHHVTVPCHQDMSAYTCQLEVEQQLPNCGHRATMPCHQNPATFACQKHVTKSLPNCGHHAQLLCHQNADDYACPEPVEKRFASCSHRKQLTCHQLQDPTTNLCREPVEREIPTCKHRATMPCHKNATRHKCQKRIEKKLPFCEHYAWMPCHQGPETYFCSKPCGGALSCCSGACSAKCGACRKLNPNEIGSSARTRHSKHKCSRRMTCGHACNTPCREGHNCSKICKGKCQQSCSHSNCRRKCSTPCKPCEKPCAWKCAHTECTSPCGMACTRLPCDEKCPKILGCGHPCPSVCGEPCDYQTCKMCNEDTLDSVVGLLRQIRLRDLGDNGTLDSMTITLPCRHVFTVKALDSITRIQGFYERDAHGRWTKAIMPNASEMLDRPACPHCGGGIDALRYGRVLKYSNHSILQHNVARSLSERLVQAERLLSGVRSGLEQAITNTISSFGTADFPIPSDATRNSLLQRIARAVAAKQGFPTSSDLVQHLSTFHGFPPKHTKAWRKAVDEIMEPYRIVCDVTRESDPSASAYERSLTQLHQEELNKSGGNTVPTTDPDQQALRQLAADTARVRIGHIRPRASDRFIVEAFWISIEILMLLGLATSKACEAQQQDEFNASAICWEGVAEFLLLRASKDTETALGIAEKSRSKNKVIKCRLLILQAEYELAAHKCRVALRNGILLNREIRDEYFRICARGIEQVQGLQVSVPRDYQGGARQGSTSGIKGEWVREHFVQPAQRILEAWNNLNRSIHVEMPGWRQEEASAGRLISWRPTAQAAAASNRKWHTENFYQCPRGHPYTRGECTSALGRMWCPECGTPVGNQR